MRAMTRTASSSRAGTYWLEQCRQSVAAMRSMRLRPSKGAARALSVLLAVSLAIGLAAVPASAVTPAGSETSSACGAGNQDTTLTSIPGQVGCTYYNRSTDGLGGAPDYFTVPANSHRLHLVLNGGALGGLTTAKLVVEPGQVLQVNVGGRGEQGGSIDKPLGHRPRGGWNGGGAGGTDGFTCTLNACGDGGNGAVDVRTGSYGLADRVLVAGGAGGFNSFQGGGEGGGLSGNDGATEEPYDGRGGGGSQSAGGRGGGNAEGGGFGHGGNAGDAVPTLGTTARGGSGGGGGWMGGGGGSGRVYGLLVLVHSRGSGGGGSGHAGPGAYEQTLATGGGSGSAGAVSIRSIPDDYPTTTTVRSSQNPSAPGESLTFTVTVKTADPFMPLGGGTVTLRNGYLGTALMRPQDVTLTPGSPGTGTATFDATGLPANEYAVIADYSGYSQSTPESTYTNVRSSSDGVLLQLVGTSQTITFDAPTGVSVRDADRSLGATASSGLPVSYTSTTTDVCTIASRPAWPYSVDQLHVVAAGTCTVQADQAGGLGYMPAPRVERTFTIGKTLQTITVVLNSRYASLAWAAVSFYGSASSGLPVTYTSTTNDVCTIEPGTSEPLGRTYGKYLPVSAGTCTIRADQAGDADFAAAELEHTFTIAKASQTVTFVAPTGVRFGDADVSLGATASSGLPVSYASTTTDVCTIAADNKLHVVGGGTCTIRADQAGDATFGAAPQVERTFAIAKASQTVTFVAPTGVKFGDADVSLGATASSGLPVSYASTTTDVCTIAADKLHVVGAGTCTVQADQAGDVTFGAAPQVERTFAIAKASQTVTFVAPTGVSFGDADVSLGATASSGLPVSYAMPDS